MRELVARVGAFHITDRALRRAQHAVEAAIGRDEFDAATLASYLKAAGRYFERFDSEARSHLRDVDRRLERANQVQFNLTAERAVAVKRIEATLTVLTALRELRDATP